MANDVTITFNGQPSSLLAAFSQINAASQETENALGRVSSQGDENTSMLGRLGGAVSGILSPLTNFAGQLANVFETMALWRIMDQVTAAIQDMTDAWFQLNDATQKNIYTWKYLLPGGMDSAQQLAQWTAKESLNIPYTRQDMLNAITTMAGLNLNMNQIQQYLPMLADLGATRAPDRNLASIANIVAGAEFGVTRMLRYDLHIDPKELAQYGYTEGKGADASMFLPALQAWAEAHGYTGAAKDIANNTFWGAWSSFLDRIQNFQLDFGAHGFQELQTLLVNLSSWIDNNQDKIGRVADLLSGALATGIIAVSNAFKEFYNGATGKSDGSIAGGLGSIAGSLGKDLVTIVGGLTTGFSKGGGGEAIASMVNTIAQALGNPNVAKGAGAIAMVLGLTLGTGLSAAAQLLTAIANTIGFIATHEMVLDLFLAVLIEIGSVMLYGVITSFVASLPAIIAYTVAMGAAAAANIAATWEFLVIGAAIASVIAGVILLVSHWSDVTKTVGSWWKDFSDFFKNLATSAWQWGVDFINSLTGGISHTWNITGGALLNGIGGTFRKILGHSKPDEGPMHDDDVWMTHMMQGFQQQIMAGLPGVTQASMMAANAIGGPLMGLGSYGGGGSSYGGSYATTTSTNYGGTTIYGASDGYIRQLINTAIAQQGTQTVVMTKQPGGFRRPGPGGVIAF